MTITESYRGYDIHIVSTSDRFHLAKVWISSHDAPSMYVEADPPVDNPMELVKKARAFIDAKLNELEVKQAIKQAIIGDNAFLKKVIVD